MQSLFMVTEHKKRKKTLLGSPLKQKKGIKDNLKRDQKGSEMTTYVIFINYL